MGDAAEDTERRAEREAEDEVIDVIVEELEGAEVLEPVPGSAQALVIREEREQLPAPASVLPSSKEWEATMAVAREIASTEFVPESYRGKPDAVVAAILTGREMGIGPMQALRQIHMIDGRPAFSADLMMAKMRAGGVTVIESSVDEKRAFIKAKRKDTGEEADVEWTLADAEKANLLGKRNWKTYPTDMLWARAVGRLARRLGSDLLGGLVYAKEEMEDWDDGGYGGDAGFEATTAKPFDPEKDLAPGAIHGEDAPKQIGGELERFDPTVEWKDVTAQLVLEQYGKERKALTEEEWKDFFRRMANSVWFIGKGFTGDFPPLTKQQLVDGFAYGFSGAPVEIVYKEAEKPPEKADKSDAALSPEQQEKAKEALKKDDDPGFGEKTDA